jgi:hypothetical protein
MKAPKQLPLLLGTLLVLTTGTLAADPVADLFTEARAAAQKGDYDAAKAKLLAIKTLNPGFKPAAALLQQIQAQEAAQGGGMDRTLATLIIPSVQYREAELTAALGALRQEVGRLTNGKQIVNFVIQLPEAQAKLPITLALSNVPFTEVLKYLGTLAGVSFSFDKYAIMVRPASNTGPAPAPAPAEDAPKIKGL